MKDNQQKNLCAFASLRLCVKISPSVPLRYGFYFRAFALKFFFCLIAIKFLSHE